MNLRQLQDEGMAAISNLCEVTLSYRHTQKPEERTNIYSATDAYYLIKPFYGMDIETREMFFCILLNQASQVVAVFRLSSGGITATVADKRLIVAAAINCLASKVLLVHNHPSGNLKASQTDRQLTNDIKKACSLLDIQVLDHLIVSEYGFLSFSDEGFM